MKQMKKITAIFLTAVLMLAMSATAAADWNTTNGTITVENAIAGTTYNAYQLLTMEVNETTGAYRYKTTDDWADFFEASAYFDVAGGYVTAKSSYTEAIAAQVAKAAERYAETNSLTPTATAAYDADGTSFTGLDCGYYLLTSPVGSLCALATLLPDDSTAPSVTLEEKNDLPTLTKGVSDTETGTPNASISAEFGSTVYYTITIDAEAGAENYVVTDTLDNGLTPPDAEDVTVMYNDDDITDNSGVSISVSGQTITVDLTDYCEGNLTSAYETFVITYPAVLNTAATVGSAGNENGAELTYGDVETPKTAIATVYTYSFDLVKTDASNQLISGAEFRLYRDADCTDKIGVAANGTDYRIATDGDTPTASITAGNVTIAGLASGTYYLKETKAPDGYKKVDAAQSITIVDGNLDAVLSGTAYASGGVQVINESGVELPTTGGIGTTVFYAVGVVLMSGACAVLLRRKRRGAEG